MFNWFPNLIDALKDGKSDLWIAVAVAGMFVWINDWSLPWISDVGLVLSVSSCSFLMWRLYGWGVSENEKRKFKKAKDLNSLRADIVKRRDELRAYGRRPIRDSAMFHKLAVLYSDIGRFGLATPALPSAKKIWFSEDHISYLESIHPYLKPHLLIMARNVAKELTSIQE